jgi:Trypsin-like peptidase domain
MDETTLRALLDSALTDEPPIGPVADKAMRAGSKLRRRRVLSTAGSMAVAAAIAVVIPGVTGPLGAPTASRQHSSTMRVHESANVPPPDNSVLRWRALAKDRASIVKIIGEAKTTCNLSLEGSGFVVSPQHVLTNAHVVAGMTNGPDVGYGTGKTFPAKVVLFDWNTDVAILYVPHLTASALRFTGPAPLGSNAVMAGYPENGPFQAVPARVGSRWSNSGYRYYEHRVRVHRQRVLDTGHAVAAVNLPAIRPHPGGNPGHTEPLSRRRGEPGQYLL